MTTGEIPPVVSLTEVQAFLRLETGDEEALLAGLVRSATAICEGFLNLALIERPFQISMRGTGNWQTLDIQPVRSILAVISNAAALAAEQFQIDIDANGAACVKLPAQSLCDIEGTAGLASDQNGVPEPIRQGVIRLVGHLYAQRDGDGAAPPAIVTALWRPFRRMVFA